MSRGFRMRVGVRAAALAFIAVVGLGVIGSIAHNSSRHVDGAGNTRATPTGTPAPSGPQGTPTRPDITPAAGPPAAAAQAGEGDCLRITGSSSHPTVGAASCGLGTYLVVARFEKTADTGRCREYPESNSWYTWEDRADPSKDFVLCLRR